MSIISSIMLKCVLIISLLTLSTYKVSATTSPPSPLAMSPSPAQQTAGDDCTTLIYNMSDCLTYVEKGSNVSEPDEPCCGEVGKMLDTKPVCLCHLLSKSKDFPVELDVGRALGLGHVCGLSTPSLSLCSGIPIGGPAAEPTSSEQPSSSGQMSSDEAGETSAASNIHFGPVYHVACLALLLTSSFSL
ncbi:hypothetical protein vseg_010144 [Gypsophila vaccaria]